MTKQASPVNDSVLLPWSRLRNVGKSTAARVTLLLPLVGYLIIFNKKFADALESKYNDFGLIRSIANAAKHLKLGNLSRPSRVVNAANHAANTAVHVPGAGVGGYGVGAGYGTPGLSYAGHPRVVLSGPNGTNMEFFNVATAVYDMWTTLRTKHGWW